MRLLSDSEISVSSSDFSVTTEEAPNSNYLPLMVPPDCSDLSAIQTILTIDAWQNKKDKVLESLTRLANLCLENQQHRNIDSASAKYRRAVHQAGGASILAGVMRKWYRDERIQAEGCRALMNASYKEAGLFCESARRAGCQGIIVGAMKNHAESFAVQRNGCGALANMFYGGNLDDKQMVTAAEAIDQIVAAMKKFPHHTALQSHGCLALWNLVKTGTFLVNALVVQSGARTVLAHALDTHQTETIDPNIQKIQKYGHLALKCLLV